MKKVNRPTLSLWRASCRLCCQINTVYNGRWVGYPQLHKRCWRCSVCCAVNPSAIDGGANWDWSTGKSLQSLSWAHAPLFRLFAISQIVSIFRSIGDGGDMGGIQGVGKFGGKFVPLIVCKRWTCLPSPNTSPLQSTYTRGLWSASCNAHPSDGVIP